MDVVGANAAVVAVIGFLSVAGVNDSVFGVVVIVSKQHTASIRLTNIRSSA